MGRQILDGVVVTNEIVYYAQRKKKKCVLLKVDFAQAYDCVDWAFLKEMLINMGFRTRWLKWMKGRVFKSNMSVLVNESPTEEFNVYTGLRQGDPLSPYLFTIDAEGLARMVRRATLRGDFLGFTINGQESYDLLQFDDDTIIVGEGTWSNLWAIKLILRGFEMVSGLRVNMWKSKLSGIGIEDALIHAVGDFLSCKLNSMHLKFLGLTKGKVLSGLVGKLFVNIKMNGDWGLKMLLYSIRLYLPNDYGGSLNRMIQFGEEYWRRNMVISIKIGDGVKVPFWNMRWIGHRSFRYIFPNLYQIVVNVTCRVNSMGRWESDCWLWQIEDSLRGLNAVASAEMRDLLVVVVIVKPKCQIRDDVIWLLEGHHVFVVMLRFCRAVWVGWRKRGVRKLCQ
ncbi:uncharacterized protein LOC131619997 [Vicia villosa]|uniref:uncharacterized protein LOC131619997 n=1 Tax=Vicia villosa TaxID=3911 RepID=UPI00273CBCB4|nr:uncharacterized protein LOC131619997 [Vicia villosa]